MTHWKQAIVLPVKSREVYVSCYPNNYVMRSTHQSVGVMFQSFLNLWRLLHSGYKGTNLQGLTPHYMYSMFPGKEVIATKHLGQQQSKTTHIPQLTLSTLHTHSTTDIINSLHEESNSEIEFQLNGKLFISVTCTCVYIVSVKSKLQPPSTKHLG